jgi:acyl-CoA synthetase (AMP-forming)/AMP-acid ligase II
MTETSTRPTGGAPSLSAPPAPDDLRSVARLGSTETAPGLMEVIDHRASTQGDRTYLSLCRSARALSFGELRQKVLALGGWMDDQGIDPGQQVGLAIADPLDFALAYLGVIATGRWATPLDPSAPPRAAVTTVRRLRPSLVLSDQPQPSDSPVPWVALDTLPGPVPADDPTPGPDPAEPMIAAPPAGGGAILLSSGSTGTPKVIVLHQHQLLHTARSVATHHQLSESDRGFSPLPLFHVNAQVVGVLAALCSGAQLVLDERFHRTDFWKVMEDQRVTWINAVPAILAHLGALQPHEAVPPRIRFARSASAPLPMATLHRFEQATGVPVIETYGMTEAASQIAANPLDGPRKPGSVGLPVGIELRITDAEAERGREVEPGRVGQVEIRGPSVDPPPGGRTGDGPGSNAGRVGRWLMTGDYGYRDGDGYLFLVGRRDDVINRGGEKMFPREIEELLLEEPGVEAALVVAEPHEALGQVPVAYLVVRDVDGTTGVPRALDVARQARDRADGALPASRRPVRLYVVDRLPTTATGKVSRRAVARAGMEPLVTLDSR